MAAILSTSILSNWSFADDTQQIENIRILDHPTGNEILTSRCESTAVKVLLDLHKLPYTIQFKENVEYISTNGRFPVIIFDEKDVVSGFQELVIYLQKRGKSLSEDLSEEAKCEMEAFSVLVTGRLEALEMFTSWLIEDNYTHVTLPAYSADMNWPLSAVLPFLKKRQVYRQVASKGQWNDISEEMVMVEIKLVATALSARLEQGGTFYKDSDNNDKVTELDALVYGHLNAIFMTKLPSYRMKRALVHHPKLIDFCKHMESAHLKRS